MLGPDGRRSLRRRGGSPTTCPTSETVKYQVRNAAGAVVRGPGSLGTLAAGARSFVSNGLLDGGARATSGAYKVELVTTRTIECRRVARPRHDQTSRVDQLAPTHAAPRHGVSGSGFCPYPDTYRDSVRAGHHERGRDHHPGGPAPAAGPWFDPSAALEAPAGRASPGTAATTQVPSSLPARTTGR